MRTILDDLKTGSEVLTEASWTRSSDIRLACVYVLYMHTWSTYNQMSDVTIMSHPQKWSNNGFPYWASSSESQKPMIMRCSSCSTARFRNIRPLCYKEDCWVNLGWHSGVLSWTRKHQAWPAAEAGHDIWGGCKHATETLDASCSFVYFFKGWCSRCFFAQTISCHKRFLTFRLYSLAYSWSM